MRAALLYILLPLVLLFVIFYLWGSSGSLSPEQLHHLETYYDREIKGSDTLSVMTYNLGYLSGMTNNLALKPPRNLFEDNLASAKTLLGQLQPDVVCFQEIDFGSRRSYHMDQLDSLSSGYRMGVRSVNWDKNYVPFPYWPPKVHFGKTLSGQAILSKFPVQSSERMVLDKPRAAPFYYNAFYLDRLIQVAEIAVRNKTLVVVNVHLEAFDQQTRESQAQEVLKVVESYFAKGPLILLGDFNARPPYASDQNSDEQTIKMFLEHPLLKPAIDPQRSIEKDNFTFDTAAPYEKLDYIFFTHQSIKIVNAFTVKDAGKISDHFPVYMSFTFIE